MTVEVTTEEKQKLLSVLRTRAEICSLCAVRYLELGVCTIRVLCYTPEILPLLERQLGYVLRNEAERYDSTITVWRDDCADSLVCEAVRQLPLKKQARIRVERLVLGKLDRVEFKNPEDGSMGIPLILNFYDSIAGGYDPKTKTYYYGSRCFEPEVFVKQGHVFVRIINRLVKSGTVNLTHGAVFGCAGRGFLLCGRGKRGKSTLTVESMLQGFEYVSDDYQILKKTEDGLLAYPIYSIVTLSYRMYNEMYDRFLGKFVCNNFTQDKYLFNIAAYHAQFRAAYPIRFCLFPEIVPDEHPGIASCTSQEKGRAVLQMIHSTLSQMNDLGEKETVRKLLLMVWNLPFVKFRLCNCIPENTAFLRQYLMSMPELQPDCSEISPKLLDITSGLVTILDTRSLAFTEMNPFASHIFILRLSGTDMCRIRKQLGAFAEQNPELLREFDRLMALMDERDYDAFGAEQCPSMDFMPEIARACRYKISVSEPTCTGNINLLQ